MHTFHIQYLVFLPFLRETKTTQIQLLQTLLLFSSVGGTGLQFKKESGGTITGLHLVGYDVDLDLKDSGALSNVQIDGATADATLYSGETNKYKLNSGKNAAPLEISKWSWITPSL